MVKIKVTVPAHISFYLKVSTPVYGGIILESDNYFYDITFYLSLWLGKEFLKSLIS